MTIPPPNPPQPPMPPNSGNYPPVPPPVGSFGSQEAPKNNGKALTSMILGISSVALCCYWFIALPLAIAAVVLGILGRKEITAGRGQNKGMALTGIITGGVGIFAGILLGIATLFLPQIADYCDDNPDNAFCEGFNESDYAS